MRLFCSQEQALQAKREWELTRLKSMKEEEELRAEVEEDEMLFTYSRDDAYNQVKHRGKKTPKPSKKQTPKSPGKRSGTRSSPKDEPWTPKPVKISPGKVQRKLSRDLSDKPVIDSSKSSNTVIRTRRSNESGMNGMDG